MKALKFNLSLIFMPIIALVSSQCSAGVPDSILYENDSMFTIESVQKELSDEGEWIKVNKDEIDPEGVESDQLEEMDNDINTDWVWRPYNVEPGWSPYINGYWSYTNCGWMWVSYYQWGWRTCHYGRWWWSPVWGWVWSPGFVWAPAWVVWMFYDNYCGWYPISPHIRWHHHYGWSCHRMRFHVRHWTFCHNNHYTSPINITVIVDPPGNKQIIDKARFVSNINVENGTVINKGPEVQEIEKATGKKIVSENVTKYNNVKVVTSKENEKQFGNEKNVNNEKQSNNEKKSYNEKQKNSESQSGNGQEKSWNGNNEKKQRNDGGNNNGQNNSGNEKQKGSEKKSNEKVKEKSYEQPKNYNPPEKKQSYDKPKDNTGEKKQNYESPKKNDDGNNGNKNDSQRNNPPKNKNDGQDGGKGK